MVELSKPIVLQNNVLVPAGVRLDFKNGIAKYNKFTVERMLVPLQAIKGAKGPFLNAFCAVLLNDNRGFQQVYKKRYEPWAHAILWEDYLIVYIWDTRVVLDIYAGIHAACKGGPITRRLVSKETGEVMTQVLGYNRFGWAKSLYEMSMWPAYARPDNGLPLVTKEQGWQSIIDKFNAPIKAKYAYESFSEDMRDEYAKQGLAMPDGSYPITDKEDLKNAIQAIGRAKNYEAVKAFIIKRAQELDAVDLLPESWNVAAESANYVLPYDAEVAAIFNKRGISNFAADPRYKVDIAKDKSDFFIVMRNWLNNQAILQRQLTNCSDELLYEFGQLCMNKCYPKGMLEYEKMQNDGAVMQDLSAVYMPNAMHTLHGCESAEIVPAATANRHSIVIDDIEVASITAKKLEQVPEGYDKDDEGQQKDEPNPSFAYKNTDDNKLIVKDNAGNVLKLKCLKDDIVLADDIIKEVTGMLAANENLSQDLFNAYDNATGKNYVHDIKVLYVNDLFQLCQMLDNPAVVFKKNKLATLTTADFDINFDFALDLVRYSDNVPNKVKTFIASHFGRNLRIAK